LLIAEFEMMSENRSLLIPFKLTLQEILDEDYPRESRRLESETGSDHRP
jgi:hypothetical protein